jgi:cell division protein FtsQ
LPNAIEFFMTGTQPTSKAELAQRRHQMRRARRSMRLKSSWRFGVVALLAGGAVWMTTQPTWVLRRSDQVKVEGNQFLSVQTIRALLPIQYPQSIFRTQPGAIVDTLKQKAPIIDAWVDRQIFPPSLTVRIRERTPVAQLVDPDVAVAHREKPSKPVVGKGHDLLDETGVVIPIESLNALNQTLKLPGLKILGRIETIRPQWVGFYQALRSSPVRIQQIDWRNPTNLVVTGETGTVHLGAYNPTEFSRQLRAMDGMRRIGEKIPKEQIDYIDLKNPDKPAIHQIANRSGEKNLEKNNAP